VSRIAAALTAEIDDGVCRIIGRLGEGRFILGVEALEDRARLDQRPNLGSLRVRPEAQPASGEHHRVEDLLGDVVFERPLPMRGEGAGIQAWLQQVHGEEPVALAEPRRIRRTNAWHHPADDDGTESRHEAARSAQPSPMPPADAACLATMRRGQRRVLTRAPEGRELCLQRMVWCR
jgi:hypothetical protein